jgi:hypothetical protein
VEYFAMVKLSRRIFAVFISAIGSIALPAPALSYDANGTAKVTLVEVTYMPRTILFRLDKTIGGCQSNTWIYWNPQGDDKDSRDKNAQAVLSTLLTSRTSGMSVSVHLTSDGCKAEFLYF